GHVEAVSRLCATSHGRAVCRSGAQCAFPSLKTEFVMRPTVLAALLVFSFPAVPAMAAPSGSQAVPAYVTAAINDPARAADHHDDARRQIAAVMTFAQVKPDEMAKYSAKDYANWQQLITTPHYENVSLLKQAAAQFSVPAKADLVFTAQNYHDYHDPFMGPVDMAKFDKQVFDALKPGGVFVVIDHVAPAGSGLADTDTLHRIDPA